MKIKLFLKVIIFALIFVILLTSVTAVLSVSMCSRSYNAIKEFYKEDKNTADAVYIGSSNALAYWNPMLAWEEYGIAVPTFACNAMPLACTEYFLKEAHRTQPDAVYIVNINTLGEKGTTQVNKLQRMFVYTPFSLNKVEALYRFNDFYDVGWSDMPEYCFPIIRFHSNWNNITDADFELESNGFKGADVMGNYLRNRTDFSEKYKVTDKYVDVSEDLEDSINHMLDYCDKEKLRVVFVTVPQARNEKIVGKFNTVNKIISDRGYKTIDLLNDAEALDEMNFDITKDLYNNKHTNIHGSRKFTYYMSEYLVDNFKFDDKRKDEEYSGWNTASEKYMNVSDTALLDFEYDRTYDTSSLSAPSGFTVTATDKNISVNWNEVDGADGYTIYERAGLEGKWTKIGETEECSFIDNESESNKEFYYRVVPFKEVDNKKVYGDYSYKGVNVVAP